jgi:hypothetical protein
MLTTLDAGFDACDERGRPDAGRAGDAGAGFITRSDGGRPSRGGSGRPPIALAKLRSDCFGGDGRDAGFGRSGFVMRSG